MAKRTKADLITGFLGSGKTTFIKKYAKYHLDNGEKVALLENDYGAINVDMLILKQLEKDGLHLEMVAGGADHDCHIRRFRTKLITLNMLGFDRVIVEPSGISDIDEFQDILRDEQLENRYDINNIVAVVRSDLEKDLSDETNYILASEVSQAGTVILSRAQQTTEKQQQETVDYLNNQLKKINSRREINSQNTIAKDWDNLTKEDYEQIDRNKHKESAFTKLYNMDSIHFNSLFYMNLEKSKQDLEKSIREAFKENPNIFRIKGFVNQDNQWYEINATKDQTESTPIEEGQDILIVIGENISPESIDKHFPSRFSTSKTM